MLRLVIHAFIAVAVLTACPAPSARAAAPDTAVGRRAPRAILYLSRDAGTTWTAAPGRLPEGTQVSFMEPWGRRLVIATDNHGLYLGDPMRGDWAPAGRALPGSRITALHVSEPFLFVGLFGKGLFASHNGGRLWVSLNEGLGDLRVRAILRLGSELLVATDTGIFRGQPGRWKKVFDGPQVVTLNHSGSLLVAGTAAGTLASRDGGMHWRWIHRPGAAHNTAILDGRVVLMNVSGDLLASRDGGATWASLPYGPRERAYVYETVRMGTRWFASNNYGIHRSDDRGATWRLVHPREDLVFMDLVAMNGVLYGGTRDWGERRERSGPASPP